MRFTFKVTKSILNCAIPDDCSNCPVALALKRKGFTDVTVYPDRINCVKGQQQYAGRTSQRLRKFINRVDSTSTDSGTVSPQIKPTKLGMTLRKVLEGTAI